ncbi:MAG: Uma2 family endonuclease [Magnetospirillum sp. WYHS-4]
MAQAVLKQPLHMTVEEFLAWDDGTDTRHELVGGEVFAMAPSSAIHTRLVANLARDLGGRLRPPFGVNVEAGIMPSAKSDAYYQADLAVSCIPLGPSDKHVPDPKVIVEVLSPSTANYDRGTKLPDYRTIPSVQEIVLISSTAMKAELWHRADDGWTVNDIEGMDAVLRLSSIEVELPLAAIYESIAFEAE